ncbi:MAG: hypothetical protein ACTSQI_12875 [Candidatus Helarchaeota archaeon]
MPGVQKLSWFRKLLIGLGKRIYFRKAEKANVLGVNLMLRAIIHQYELILGDLETALKTFLEQVTIAADEVITNLIHEPIMLGVSMSYALSREIEDGPFTIQALVQGMIGNDYKKVFEYPELELNPDGSGSFIIRSKGASCILCSGIDDISGEQLSEENYGNILATLFGTILTRRYL